MRGPQCSRRSANLTYQEEFGGTWTQQKLKALSKYLKAYTTIFEKNPRAQYYSISYVDAFAGTGSLKRPETGGLAELLPELENDEEEYRKGSVKRALEIEPPFDEYVFVEKSEKKCKELRAIAEAFPTRRIEIIKEDANAAILKWCGQLNTRRERAVVFLDPFGACVNWEAIAALGRTRAVDLWVLFPYSAINRMLVRGRKPPKSWSERLTAVFGTRDWEPAFYKSERYPSLLDVMEPLESVHKTADYRVITDFFVARLKTEFLAVSEPLPLYTSRGLLFMLFFAAGNAASAKTGLKIANQIIGPTTKHT